MAKPPSAVAASISASSVVSDSFLRLLAGIPWSPRFQPVGLGSVQARYRPNVLSN
jgi:hypothetical protein